MATRFRFRKKLIENTLKPQGKPPDTYSGLAFYNQTLGCSAPFALNGLLAFVLLHHLIRLLHPNKCLGTAALIRVSGVYL